MSDALFETGDYDNANQIIETLQKNFEGEPSILYRQARMFELHGDNKHAIGNLKRAVASIDSSTAEDSESKSWYHLQLGERYVRIGNLKSAEAEYQIALKLAPNSGFPLEHLAEIAAILKQYDRAQQLFLDATKLTPRPDLIQAQGDIAAAKGDNQLATEFFKRAKEAYEKGNSDERSPYDHHLTGLYADSLADPEKAIFYARKDLNARKTLGTYDALAWALFRAGKYEEAKSMIDKATQWGTQDGHLLYHASMIYGANGDLEKSSELLKSAKAITAYVNSFHIHR